MKPKSKIRTLELDQDRGIPRPACLGHSTLAEGGDAGHSRRSIGVVLFRAGYYLSFANALYGTRWYIQEFRKITSDRMGARAVDLLVGQINDTRGGYIFILLVMAAVVLLTNLITGCRRAL